MRLRLWSAWIIVCMGVSGLGACGDGVIGTCSGGLSYVSVFLVEVRYVTDYNYAGAGFTVTASQGDTELMSRTTDGQGLTIVYVSQPGITKICAYKSGFAKKCKSFESVLGNVTHVTFTWQIQQLHPVTEVIKPETGG